MSRCGLRVRVDRDEGGAADVRRSTEPDVLLRQDHGQVRVGIGSVPTPGEWYAADELHTGTGLVAGKITRLPAGSRAPYPAITKADRLREALL